MLEFLIRIKESGKAEHFNGRAIYRIAIRRRLTIYLSIYLSIYLFIYLSLSAKIMLNHSTITELVSPTEVGSCSSFR
ncbi:hypothetical protein HZH68_015857 [Vespula germanica]|uniref:Uncharacterized protein n=1 Tax=Vespula germanica TaxID=30212 RepID=A0A834J5J2_VESGE|nr:hypothetical protein HZH68_015857 [Vespula germanica]